MVRVSAMAGTRMACVDRARSECRLQLSTMQCLAGSKKVRRVAPRLFVLAARTTAVSCECVAAAQDLQPLTAHCQVYWMLS